MTIKMKVIDIESPTLKLHIDGCKHIVEEEKRSGTLIGGRNRGIDDALKLVENEKDLTHVMRMAVLGLRHSYDDVHDKFMYTTSDIAKYSVGYNSGINDAVRILTGTDLR